MEINRAPEGLEAALAIKGIGRFLSAGFLALWLAFWTAGEGFALWMLIRGAWALMTGEPPEAGREPLNPGGAIPMGLFLVLWLTVWTFGGLMAGRELLRLLFGRDFIRVRPEALEVEHSYGVFRTHKHVPRDDVRRFYQRSRRGALCVETPRTSIELTRLGTITDRDALEQTLKAEFHLYEAVEAQSALPDDWREIPSAEGESVLVKNPEARHKQAMIVWIVCTLFTLGALYTISKLPEQENLWVAACILSALAMAIGYGAMWLSFGRNEWILCPGRLVLQRRFRGQRTQKFDAVALELFEDHSGDSGPSYILNAVAANAPARSLSYSSRKHRRRIYSRSDDPTEARHLGRWISRRCQIPFEDLATGEAQARELEQWKKDVAAKGPLGKAVVQLVDRIAPAEQPPEQRGNNTRV